jgi:micrococcal nuclease
MYHYKCLVTNVVDGDTFDGIVDMGFRIKGHIRFRLLGIDTPELRPRKGTAAEKADEKVRAKAATMFLADTILDETVEIYTAKGDSFGRWLATVHHDGVNVNDLMISSGHAKEYKK